MVKDVTISLNDALSMFEKLSGLKINYVGKSGYRKQYLEFGVEGDESDDKLRSSSSLRYAPMFSLDTGSIDNVKAEYAHLSVGGMYKLTHPEVEQILSVTGCTISDTFTIKYREREENVK